MMAGIGAGSRLPQQSAVQPAAMATWDTATVHDATWTRLCHMAMAGKNT